MEIGDRVRQLRKSRGMTQGDLAEATHMVNQVYISRLETGRLKNVKPMVLKALASVLDVSAEYLLLGEGPAASTRETEGQPVQRFLTNFFSLGPSQQDEVMHFTAFISGSKKESFGVKPPVLHKPNENSEKN